MSILQQVLLAPDTRANQPAANTVTTGSIYCVTDEDNILEQSDGATWVAYSPTGSGSGIDELTGDVTAGPGSGAQAATIAQKYLPYAMVTGRLTTESGVPVSTADRTAQGTIYFTPYGGNQIGLYTGVVWAMYTFTERSLALSVSSGSNYDVFLYDDVGTLTLELSAAWTNNTTRADALALQDGVYVKSGATTRRYLGTIRASGANVTADALATRFVWNAYNRVVRPMQNATETTNSWVYTTNTFRQANANAANQLAYVAGLSEDAVEALVRGTTINTTANVGLAFGVGVDSTSVSSAYLHGINSVANVTVAHSAHYRGYPGIGYHALVWLEKSGASGASTWFGDDIDATMWQSGIMGTVLG